MPKYDSHQAGGGITIDAIGFPGIYIPGTSLAWAAPGDRSRATPDHGDDARQPDGPA